MRQLGLVAASLAVVVGLAAAAPAQDKAAGRPEAGKPAAKEPGTVAPEAQRVLDRVKAHYTTLPGATLKATISLAMKVHDTDQNQERTISESIQRPNKVVARPEGDEADQYAFVSDGENCWLYLGAPLNKYQTTAAPKAMGELLDAAALGEHPQGLALMMQPHLLGLALMDWTPIQTLVSDAEGVTYVGKEEVAGAPVERIRIATKEADVDLMVAAQGDPWVVQIKPDLTKMAAAMQGAAPDVKVKLDWAKKAEFDAGTFAFKPPEGSEKVASLADAMQKEMGQEQGGDDAHEKLLGAPAPELNLDLLDGGKVSLAQYKDKNIVVLDFWATWCPPCVAGLPVISKLTADMKDKGVVFIAVNQQESPDTIKGFLEKKGLKIPVALDKAGAAARAYGVGGIPQTVLIGKDGTVQAVHVGYAEGSETEIGEQLKKLADGGKLAEPKKDEGKKGEEKKDEPKK